MSLRTQLSQLKWDIFSLMSAPLCLCPIEENKIVFQNFSGRGYGDNPKYIAESIIKNSLNYQMVWLCNNVNEEMPAQIRQVKYGSPQAYYEMATAGIWINNVWTGLYTPKRKKQFFIQTWHGSIALKKIEKAAMESLPSEYVRTAKRMSNKCDLMISNAQWLTELYRKDFWYNGEILEKGLPRLDILYNTPSNIKENVYKYYGISLEKKIILFAPTFRKNEEMSNYIFDFSKCCVEFERKFGGSYVILHRLHPNAAKYQDHLPISDAIYNATNYPDMQELLAVSDALITDYSSSMFEMGMINRKVFILAKDFDNYRDQDRGGTLFTPSELPFSISYTDDELFTNIRCFDSTIYESKVTDFFAEMGIISSDHSALDIISVITSRHK